MLTDNQKNLFQLAGKVAAQLVSLAPADAVDAEQLIVNSMQAELTALAGAKASGVDITDNVLEIAKATANEFNNPKAVKLVDDLAQTGEDAVNQQYFKLFTDVVTDFTDAKNLTKKQ